MIWRRIVSMNAYKEYDSYLSLTVEHFIPVIHKSVEDYAHPFLLSWTTERWWRNTHNR